MDSIFRTITTFCAYPESFFFFHSLVLEQQSDSFFYRLYLCLHLLFYENNLICCLLKSSYFLKCFQFPADMSKPLFSPFSFPDSLFSFFWLLDKQYMLWVVVTSWFFWLTYLGIGSCSANNQGQAATHRRVLMWIFPTHVCCLCSSRFPYRSNCDRNTLENKILSSVAQSKLDVAGQLVKCC